MSAAGLAAAIAAGEVSALEVTDAHLARIGEVDDPRPRVPARRGGRARGPPGRWTSGGRPASALGPLAGVPLALKDLFTTTDMPTTCGSRHPERLAPAL